MIVCGSVSRDHTNNGSGVVGKIDLGPAQLAPAHGASEFKIPAESLDLDET